MTLGAILLAAPTSGAGKTTITLGILRALKNAGVNIRGAKSGPDFIDPRFHEAASGKICVNLDAWAMAPERICTLAEGDGPLVIEGAMGLFDGAPPSGKGSSADVARTLGVPVALIVDASKTAQSVAPLVAGFANFSPDIEIAGVILNRVGSPRHEAMLRAALAPLDIPVLGAVHRRDTLSRPSRHLGLVQAGEHPDLEAFLHTAADEVALAIDLDALLSLMRPTLRAKTAQRLAPPAQRIAVAHDQAFAFTYPHILADWRAAGSEISFFSPLGNEAAPQCDFIYFPGGYPELHAQAIANADVFKSSIKKHAQNGTQIYGECGGYMTLGEGLIDATGARYEMLSLLPLETSFKDRELHLGYRTLVADSGPFTGQYKAHEFHYATTLRAEGLPLFRAKDAEGNSLPKMGLVQENVSGSFAHIIDKN